MGGSFDIFGSITNFATPEKPNTDQTQKALEDLKKGLTTVDDVKAAFLEENLNLSAESKNATEQIFENLKQATVNEMGEATMGAYIDQLKTLTNEKMDLKATLIERIKGSAVAMQFMDLYLQFTGLFSDDKPKSKFYTLVSGLKKEIDSSLATPPSEEKSTEVPPAEGGVEGAEADFAKAESKGFSDKALEVFKNEVAEEKSFFTLMEHPFLQDPEKGEIASQVILEKANTAFEGQTKARLKAFTEEGFTLYMPGTEGSETHMSVNKNPERNQFKLQVGDGETDAKKTIEWDDSLDTLPKAIGLLDSKYSLESVE